MKKVLQLFLAAALVLGVVIILRWLFPSDESRIRKCVENLAITVSFSTPQSALAVLATAGQLRDLLAPDVRADFSGISGLQEHVQGREEIIQMALAARSQLRQLRVRLVDIQIQIGPDRQSAGVYTVAMADLDEEKNAVVQMLKLELEKAEKKWRVARMETIEKPGR